MVGDIAEDVGLCGLVVGDSEDDGALEADGDGVVGVESLEVEGRAGCETAECAGYFGGEAIGVIEGDDVVVPGVAHEVVFGAREWGESGGSWVDQSAELAHKDCFATAGGAFEDEDGVRAGGAERAE